MRFQGIPRPLVAMAALAALAACQAARSGEQPPKKSLIRVDREALTISVPAKVAQQGKHAVLKGAIEYVLTARNGKDYETVFATDLPAEDIYKALLDIGLKPGRPAGEKTAPQGKPVEIVAVYKMAGKTLRRAVDEFVVHIKTRKPLAATPWPFCRPGVVVDPDTQKQVISTTLTGSVIGLHYSDNSALFQNPRPESRQENLYAANLKKLPPPGTPLRIEFRRVMPKVPKGVRRVHLFISGRVQGVGFRAFTQRQARGLGLNGWVRNLKDGRVEAVIEGQGAQVDKLLAKLKTGPRAARVKDIQIKTERPELDTKKFEVRW